MSAFSSVTVWIAIILALTISHHFNSELSEGGYLVKAATTNSPIVQVTPTFDQGPKLLNQDVLRVGAWNINGLQRAIQGDRFKIPIIEKLLNQFKFDVFVIGESKTRSMSASDLKDLDIAGYKYVREERSSGKGGGVLIYISDRLKLNDATTVVKQTSSSSGLEYIHLKLESGWNIVGAYLTPISASLSRGDQLNTFKAFLNDPSIKGEDHIIILGDFNINTFPSVAEPEPPYPFFDVTAAGFRQLIKSTTSQSFRRPKNAPVGRLSYAGLDHIYVKANEQVEESGVMAQWDIRDPPLKNFHHIIYCTVQKDTTTTTTAATTTQSTTMPTTVTTTTSSTPFTTTMCTQTCSTSCSTDFPFKRNSRPWDTVNEANKKIKANNEE